MSSTPPKSYTGSCHCGLTKYDVQLPLPPITVMTRPPLPGLRIGKCNCTTCQKLSFFHIRLPNAPEQFQLLSPISATDTSIAGGLLVGPNGLQDYLCNSKKIHWYFCSRCGVRCFAFFGKGELRAPPSPSANTSVTETGGPRQVWTPKREGWKENGGGSYLTVNAATLDAGQEGLDLREWHEKGWIVYLDLLADQEGPRVGKPHMGGMY